MPEIVIDNFRGGKNTFDHQLLIADSECASGSSNVWAPFGALAKIAGATLLATHTATGNGTVSVYLDSAISTSNFLYHRIQSATSAFGSASFPWTGGITDSMTPLGYTTGSVSVSGASLISATGNGTTWASHVSAGDAFRIDATAARWLKIASVEDNTHLTLATGIAAAVVSGTAYTVMPGMDRVEIGWASFNGSVFAGTIANILQQYDSTGMVRISAAPVAPFWQVHKNYLFAARTTTAESRLYWSAIKAPTSWPGSNFIDIDKDRGKITGLFAFGSELIVFKSYGLYKVVGETFDPSNPTYAVYPIVVPTGFRFNSAGAVAVWRGFLTFYSHGRIYTYAPGSSAVVDISKKWRFDLADTFEDVNVITGVDQRIYAVAIEDHFILKGFQNSRVGGNEYGLILDPNGAAWFVKNASSALGQGILASTPLVVQAPTSRNPRILTVSKSKSRLYAWDVLASGRTIEDQFIEEDDGTELAIDSTWLSREFNIGYGTFRRLVIYFQKQTAGNLSVDWSIDQAAFVVNTVDMTVGRGQLIRKVLNINQRGSTIQLRLRNSVVNQTFAIYGIRVQYDTADENRLT